MTAIRLRSMTGRWAAAFIAMVVAAGCAADAEDATSDNGETVHIHEVLVEDDGTVLLATHLGLRRVSGDGLELVGTRRHDLMAATIDGDTLLASGHPELGDDSLRVVDRPPLLGLVQSDDGETWSARSLLGEADFHGLVIADGQRFAANSSESAIWVSKDAGETWQPRSGKVQLTAFAVHPEQVSRMIGVDLDRGLVRSADGGETWSDLDGPALVDLEWTTDGVVGLDEDGSVHRFRSETWSVSDGVDDIAALGRQDDEIYAFSFPSTVLRSGDGGTTWQSIP